MQFSSVSVKKKATNLKIKLILNECLQASKRL